MGATQRNHGSTPPSAPASPAPQRRGARALAPLAGVLLLLSLAPPAAPRADGRAPAAPVRIADGPERGSMRPGPPNRPKEFAFVYDYDACLFHLFWMRHNDALAPKDTELDFGHAVSTDLYNWTQLDSVMHVQPGTWDSSHVWAPTIIRRDGVWYMFYAGVVDVPYAWPWYQRIGVATSTDLMTWTHYDEPVYTGNMVPWAFADSSQFDGAQFRDPFVMDDPDHPGQWLMYYVTEAAIAPGQLLIAAARNEGALSPWVDVGPMWCSEAFRYWGWCESPHLFKHDSLWFMFASLPNIHPIGFRVASHPLADTVGTEWYEKYRLYDYAGRFLRNSDAWFASEFLSVAGHDYFAYVDTDSNAIGIEEFTWGVPPNFFTLGPPTLPVASVAPPPRAAGPGVRLVGRARRGSGALFAAGMAAPGPARLELFDVAGRKLRTLFDGTLPAGETLVHWDGRSESGTAVPCAMYFARATTRAGASTARVPLTD
jgi:hypothetical protein